MMPVTRKVRTQRPNLFENICFLAFNMVHGGARSRQDTVPRLNLARQQRTMMSDECGMMNEKRRKNDFIIHHSSFIIPETPACSAIYGISGCRRPLRHHILPAPDANL